MPDFTLVSHQAFAGWVESQAGGPAGRTGKKSLFSIIDGLAAKQKLKQSLTTALGMAQ